MSSSPGTPDKPEFAGDVKIDEVKIITYNGFGQEITPQVIGVEIYEDIFAPFITGKLFVRDSQALQSILPLVGEERVQLRVSTPGMAAPDNYELDCFIVKLDDRMKAKEREDIFVLHFMSKEAIIDMNKKLSQGFEGNIGDIITKIYKEGLETNKKINMERPKNDTKFIANFWSPVRCLQFMADQAVNAADSPSYIFFENKYGFHFMPLISLYQGTPVKQRFTWNNRTSEIKQTGPGQPGNSADNIEKDYQAVIEFQYEKGFNYIDRLRSGLYGSEIIYFDIMTQQYVHKGYAPEWDSKKALNPFPIWTTKVPAKTKAVLIHDHQYYNVFDKFAEVSNTKIHQERLSLLAQAEAYKVTINVFGRMDYSAGQRVYLEVPKNTQIDKKGAVGTDSENPIDELMSGYYLIGAICHNINREKHECTMELIKDSYIRELK